MATATRKASAVRELHEVGQSLWLDNIRRQLISSGELARLRDEGITGVTSNPTIFEKAVSGSTDYDEAMVQLVRTKTKPSDMLWGLMVEDVQAAADVFRPVYDRAAQMGETGDAARAIAARRLRVGPRRAAARGRIRSRHR